MFAQWHTKFYKCKTNIFNVKSKFLCRCTQSKRMIKCIKVIAGLRGIHATDIARLIKSMYVLIMEYECIHCGICTCKLSFATYEHVLDVVLWWQPVKATHTHLRHSDSAIYNLFFLSTIAGIINRQTTNKRLQSAVAGLKRASCSDAASALPRAKGRQPSSKKISAWLGQTNRRHRIKNAHVPVEPSFNLLKDLS